MYTYTIKVTFRSMLPLFPFIELMSVQWGKIIVTVKRELVS